MRIYYLIFALILISQADGQVGSDLFEEGILTVKISSGYLEKTSDLFSLSDSSLFLVSIQNDLQWNITNVSVPTAAQFVGTDDSQNRSIYGALPIHLPMGIDQGQQDLLTFTTLGSGSQAKGLQYVIGIDFLLTDGREFQLQIRNQDLYGSVTESCQDTNGYCFYWDLTNVTTSYQFNGTVPLLNTPETSKCLTDDICISMWKLQKEGEVATAMKVRLYSNTISPEILNPDSFYTIWNNQKTHALTAAVNSTNSSDPFEVYQYTNLGDSSQEWRFHFIAEEGGYAIVNEKLLLLLTATNDGTLEIQKYNHDDLSAQLWFPRRLTDGSYQIQNLEYKTFLSSENQVDNNDLWTLKETVDSSTRKERFFLNFIETDVLQDQLTAKNDYYHMIAPETAPQMGVTAISSPVSVQLQAQNTTNKQQFWLIKNVAQPNTNITGFIIMNHGLNLVLAIDANNTLIASPLISTTDAASLSQLWDVQLREGSIYSSSSYQIRNLKYTDYYLTTDAIPTGGNLFVTTAPESGFLLTRSDVKGYTPFINNIPYHISTFKTTTQYVMDTFSTNLIYGWSVTGQLKQKWKLYNATKTDGTSRPNAFYVQSMYNLSTTALTYLTYNTASGTPTSATGNFAQQDQQSWTVLADPNYYGLVYTIRTYVNANLYLTAPATKTNGTGFTLGASSVSPDDQRFRILISDETFFK